MNWKGKEGNDYGLVWATVLTLGWIDWGKPWKTPDLKPGLQYTAGVMVFCLVCCISILVRQVINDLSIALLFEVDKNCEWNLHTLSGL